MLSIPPKFSASAIETFRSCQRKWAWDKIAKVPRSTHPSAALGTRAHTQFERYLTTGETPLHTLDDGSLDITGAICEPALSELPQPMAPTLEVEQHFLFQSPRTGFLYNGFIDFRMRLPDRDGEKWALVGDHKSTGNMAYAKTPDDLLTDPQAVLYAFHTMAHFEVPNVRLQWNYVSTKRPHRHLQVIQEVHSVGVAKEFAGLEETAEEMAHVLDTIGPADVLSLEPNLNTCSAFGGCPYRHKCNLSPLDMLQTYLPESNQEMSTVQMSPLDRMRAMKAGNFPAAPDGTKLQVTGHNEFGHVPQAMSASSAVATVAASIAPPPVVVQTAFGPAPVEPGNLPAEGQVIVQPGQINPPESSAPPTAEQLHNATEAAKTRRTRATKAEMEARRAAEAPVADPVPEAPPVAPDVLPILFLDCKPLKGLPYVDASALIAAANRKVCEENKVADYRCVDYKGGAFLVLAAVELIKANPGQCLALDTETPEGKYLKNPLCDLAKIVVMG